MTAKDTLWNDPAFGPWIASMGAIPIARRQDHNGNADNKGAFSRLIGALSEGKHVCLFPEGISRYHSALAPLKNGVAHIALDTLRANKDNPDFTLNLVTCGVTYLHREKFRSDVCMNFGDTIKLKVSDLPELEAAGAKALTERMSTQLRANTLNAPSWSDIEIANVARSIYAPFGTQMSLRSYVLLTRQFASIFSREDEHYDYTRGNDAVDKVVQLLTNYRQRLLALGIKDYRVYGTPTSTVTLLWRILLRTLLCALLFTIAFPGLILWSPVLIISKLKEWRVRARGIERNLDEVTQYKLGIAFLYLSFLYVTSLLLTAPFIMFTAVAGPLYMWLCVRWGEDCIASLRSTVSLIRILRTGQTEMAKLQQQREACHTALQDMAQYTQSLLREEEVRTRKEGSYFSLRRRRKKDWNEVLRLHDIQDLSWEAEKAAQEAKKNA
eukprot:TRINITY_DN526_c1_g1_i8.p1 TRINITY_DN526_c1_g1~~TRINITY_DN526_c1_g1_i8.p1  ORF type:complete len:440 (+),score=95.24 TRINITY_DN526_c1_g1_i8:525-1844(+)